MRWSAEGATLLCMSAYIQLPGSRFTVEFLNASPNDVAEAINNSLSADKPYISKFKHADGVTAVVFANVLAIDISSTSPTDRGGVISAQVSDIQ